MSKRFQVTIQRAITPSEVRTFHALCDNREQADTIVEIYVAQGCSAIVEPVDEFALSYVVLKATE